MRVLSSFLALGLLCGTAQAEGVSVACAVEHARLMALVASDYQTPAPPATYWVGHDGQTLGPWTILQIKREMVIGRLPAGLWFQNAATLPGWRWSAQEKEFDPLPGPATLGPDDVGSGLAAMLAGCWVSDPGAMIDQRAAQWLIFLMANGETMPVLSLTDGAGKEGVWFSRGTTADWSVRPGIGGAFVLSLPDITVLAPQDDFAGRVVDRNTIMLDLPGLPGLVLRRL